MPGLPYIPTLGAVLAAIESAARTRLGPKTSIVVVDLGGGKEYKRASGLPEDMARAAATDLETYSLARVTASEYGSGPPLAVLAIAEAIRNYARGKGKSIFSVLTADSREAVRGVFGEQHGRYASTLRDPTLYTAAAARAALGGTSLAQGAVKFFDPRVQDGGYQSDRKLTYDAVGIVRRWAGDGYVWVGPIEGINEYNLMLMRPATGTVDTAPAIAAIERGRRGLQPSKPTPETPQGRETPWELVAAGAALGLSLAGALVVS